MNALVAVTESSTGMIALKATLVMLVSLILLRVVHRASAAIRHSVVVATFAVLIVLPFAGMLGPPRVLQINTPQTSTPAASRAAEGSVVISGTRTNAAEPAAQTSIPTGMILLAAYLAGGALIVVSLVAGLFRLLSMASRSTVSVAGTRIANDMARGAGHGGGIEVLISSAVEVPITFNAGHPVILLPTASAQWCDEEIGRAIRHELEHIRRNDWFTQLMARVAFAIYWPHPFTWVLWRRLRLEAERACDDAVIRTGDDAESYAEQLVTLARRLGGHGSLPALAIATPSKLGVRVEAILDRGLRRTPLTRRASLSVAVAALAFVAALAPIQLVRAAVAAVASETPFDRDDDAARSLNEALLKAAEIGDLTLIRRLLDLGAKANAAIGGDGSPLIAAARNGNIDAMQMLVDSGADVNLGVGGDGNPLIAAAEHGHLDAVRFLVERGAIVDAGVEGDGNALIAAAAANETAIVHYLLDHKASIEKVVAGDENALIHASEAGAADAVRVLISRGANVNARVWVDRGDGANAKGEWRTPLSMARRNGHEAVVNLLLSAGAKE